MKHLRIVVIFGVIAVVLLSCGGRSDGTSAATGDWEEGPDTGDVPPLVVDAMEVTRGGVLQSIIGSGTVRGVDEVRIVSEVEGTILSSPFSLGDSIDEGALLVEVDSVIQELQMREAEKLLESAEIDLTAVERRFENGSASQAELLRARSTADGARTRLRTAEKAYGDHFIRSPISGRVASREEGLSRGNYITRGTTIGRVVNLDTSEVEIALGETEIGLVEPGSPADVTVGACGGDPIQGRVHAIAAGSDPRTGSFPVVVRWENRCTTLRSGMTARVAIALSPEDQRPIIPASAIRRRNSETLIYVVVDGAVEERSIVVGRSSGDRVEVLQGLQEGEIIVVSALSSLSPGSPVEATVRGKTGELL
jgi:membrane fusion protein, multidrug efflux system